MARTSPAFVVLAAACLIGSGLALAEDGTVGSAKKFDGDVTKPVQEWLSKQFRNAILNKATNQSSPAGTVDFGKKAQEWLQNQFKPALRGAQAATRSAAPAVAPAQAAVQPGVGLQPAAKAAQFAREALAKILTPERREALAKAVTPDSVKVLNNANKHGFASNVLVTKELPNDEKTLYIFGGHSGMTRPRTGSAGLVTSAVSKDGSAQAGSIGMTYGKHSKPLYVAMAMDLPARTDQGKRLTKILSDKIREGHEHKSSLHNELVDGMKSEERSA